MIVIVRILLDGLVQGAAIVAITAVAVRCVPQRNASTRCAMWFVALLALLFVPALAVVSNYGAQLAAALRPATSGDGVVISLLPAVGMLAHDATGLSGETAAWIATVWGIGVVVGIARLAAGFVRLTRIRKRSEPCDIRGERVLVSSDVSVPIAAGLFDPVVILPRTIVNVLDPGDLERVIAHERAHIRRNDIAGNLIQRSIEAILFFNPWVYLIGRNVVLEREAACDDVAVQRTGTARGYAECLALLARSVHSRYFSRLTPSVLGSRKAVVSRIERLLRNGESDATSINYYSIGGTIVLLAILTLALQTLSPASTATVTTSATATNGSHIVAAACTAPNVEAAVVTAVAPKIPHSAAPAKGAVDILVTIGANGAVTKAAVEHSSGQAAVDSAVLNAAKASTYSPARRNCVPVAGAYVFHAEFAP